MEHWALFLLCCITERKVWVLSGFSMFFIRDICWYCFWWRCFCRGDITYNIRSYAERRALALFSYMPVHTTGLTTWFGYKVNMRVSIMCGDIIRLCWRVYRGLWFRITRFCLLKPEKKARKGGKWVYAEICFEITRENRGIQGKERWKISIYPKRRIFDLI